jgi:hypothetical protein
MKVLVIYSSKFSYKTANKNIPDIEDIDCEESYNNCILAFIQIEESDEEKDTKSREKKLVNHIKWTARKNNTKTVVLHSFAHLSESKATLGFTRSVFDDAQKRLQNAGFIAEQTPFGYFLDLKIEAPGFSLARIWATL